MVIVKYIYFIHNNAFKILLFKSYYIILIYFINLENLIYIKVCIRPLAIILFIKIYVSLILLIIILL